MAADGAVEQPVDLGERVGDVRRPVGGAVQEDGADPGLGQALDRGVGVFGRQDVVTEVAEGGRPAVELVQRAGEIADVHVARGVVPDALTVEVSEVLHQRPVGADRAQRRLPGVQVGVDQAGHEDATGEVDDFGVGCLDVFVEGGDAVAVDEDVEVFGVGPVRGHRDDLRSAQQDAAHAVASRSGRMWPCWDMMRLLAYGVMARTAVCVVVKKSRVAMCPM
ncbi:hypothetical protein ABZ250_41520 [Streptomyces afghaniensis]|uniref:hypothetical protein n=1 Tax=Streptomyces afghaniensis TaxID=66865 RepID=UPI0033AD631E